jgi:eukaryotic-like serine/threonine-protein kinase
MELVKGVPITEFCDARQLTPRARLELFVQVCHAVQHAHQKGIIHRDLKPSNVMVAMHDATPAVKVIDFGVAKALGQELTDKTLFTGFAQLVGTPLYMSPEQAGQSAIDVDTRSDIYSLGVLLYELLTGTTPFDRERFRKAAQDEIRRIVREEEPPKPSTRLSESKDSLPSISAQRHTEPAKLTRLVRGDLDWIVMKALEKDRARRYETANGFALDVQRYLADEPVIACPPSAAYRLKKFVRRNKRPVLAAAAVLLTLIGGIVGTSTGLLRADEARKAERDAKQDALDREKEMRVVLEFVEKRIFTAAAPQGTEGGLGYDVTLRQAIEAALPFVDAELAGQPLIEARLRRTLAWAFHRLGESKIAVEQAEAARALHLKHFGPDDPDTLRSMELLADVYRDDGRLAEAVNLAEETVARRKAILGADHPDTIGSMATLAFNYFAIGRQQDAFKLEEKLRPLIKPDHPSGPELLSNLAYCEQAVGRYPEALELRREALELLNAKRGPLNVNTLAAMTGLANSYSALQRHDEALKLREETVALARERLGPTHPDTLRNMANLALSYSSICRYADAVKLGEETHKLMMERLGADHADTLGVTMNLAVSYSRVGRHAEAIELGEKTLPRLKERLNPGHRGIFGAMDGLAVCYHAAQRLEDALKLREETLALCRTRLGPDDPQTLLTMTSVAGIYHETGRHADAVKLSEEALALCREKLGPHHPETLGNMTNLVLAYNALGRNADAVKIGEEALRLFKAKPLFDHENYVTTLNGLSTCYADNGREGEALRLREEALALSREKVGPDDPLTLLSMTNLAASYDVARRFADAVNLREEALALLKVKFPPGHPWIIGTVSGLVTNYTELGRKTDAAKMRDEIWLLLGKVTGPLDSALLQELHALADFDDAAGRKEDAAKLRQRLREIVPAAAAPEPAPPVAATTPTNLKTLEENLESLRQAKGAEAPETIVAMTELAAAHGADGSARKAIKLGEEALTLARRVLHAGDPRTIAAMKILVPVYRSVDLEDDARRLETEMQALVREK